MAGWIKLHRKALDNPIVCKDAEYFAVWCYLLLDVTHKEKWDLFGGKKILLQPGQTITGRKKIANAFNINESKVQRILKKLEIEHQIEQQTSSKNRLITIKNWDTYQDRELQIEQQLNNKRTTSEQQVNTYKNERSKECKNERNNICPYQDIVDLYHRYCITLPRIRKLTDKRKRQIKKRWEEFDKNLEIFEQVFKAINKSSFHLGKNNRGWKASLEWITRNSENMLRFLEDDINDVGEIVNFPKTKHEKNMEEIEKWLESET